MIETKIRTGDSFYTLLLEGVGSVSLPDTSAIALQNATLRWGDSGDDWGAPLLLSTLQTTFYDPDNQLAPILTNVGARQVKARLIGPGGFDWRGFYTADPISQPFITDRGGERQTFDVLFYDGIADIAQEQIQTRPTRLIDLLSAYTLYDKEPFVYSDIEWTRRDAETIGEDPQNTTTTQTIAELTDVRLAGFDSVTGSDSLLVDEGNAKKGLEALCEALDLRIYASPTHQRIMCVPRYRVGQDLEGFTYPGGGSIDAGSVEARTAALGRESLLGDFRYRALDDAGAVQVDFPRDHSLHTPHFEFTETVSDISLLRADPDYAWPSFKMVSESGTPKGIRYSTDELPAANFERPLIVVEWDFADVFPVEVATTEVQVQYIGLTDSVGITNVYGDRVDSDEEHPVGEQRIILEIPSDPVFNGRVQVTFTILDADELVSPTAYNVNVDQLAIRLGFEDVDDQDEVITVDTYRTGPGPPIGFPSAEGRRGQVIDVPPRTHLDGVLPDSRDMNDYRPVARYRNPFYTGTGYLSPHFRRADDRVRAQTTAVKSLRATILGVYGPEWQLRYPQKDGLKYIAGEGRKIEFTTGRVETTTYDLELEQNQDD